MANITEEINKLKAANYGGYVREAVVSAFQKINTGNDATDTQQEQDIEDLKKLWKAGTGTDAIMTKNATASTGDYSVAEGCNTTASGAMSHASGYSTTANGVASHSEGYNTTANGLATFVFGMYNQDLNAGTAVGAKGTYVEMVGNGTEENSLSNARTLDWDGNESLAGSLTIGKGSADETTITASQLKALLALLN